MRIIQVLATMSYGDAVGNDAIALHEIIEKMGYETRIYAECVDKRLKSIRYIKHTEKMGKLNKEDIVIYHLSIGSRLIYKIADYPAKLIIKFHNITPPEFFAGYNPVLTRLCRDGWNGTKYLASKAEYCIADSEYNKQNLISLGYKCHIDVLPVLVRFQDYEKEPSLRVINRYKDDGFKNILFTGRIAPNKKQEDVIASFAHYQKHHNEKSRLFLVGSWDGNEKYYHRLNEYAKQLKVQNVVFTGHIPFDEILAYYHLSDLFLCMSEHEGFCVPLLEAMYFHIPIIAYDKAAVGNTLDGSGILMDDKDPVLVGEMIERLFTDDELKSRVLKTEERKLVDFSHENISKRFEQYMKAYISSIRDR